MSLARLLSHWRAEPTVGANIVTWKEIPPRQPDFLPLPADIHPAIANALEHQGIRSLYSHQHASWQMIQQGKNTVIVTGTASGKTLCYNLPVLNSFLTNSTSRALYLFPTKALAQDQAAAIREFWSKVDISATPPFSVYDGDTPSRDRPSIRNHSRLIISNPDMLHTGILPHHTSWGDFFKQLQYVVLDEMHTYRGVFGSHVGNVIRRLKRICAFYGSSPQFILTSATIANPVELAEKLIDAPVFLVNRDGSSRGKKTILVYNPPVVNPDLGLRRSSLQEAVRIADDLAAYSIQTLVFARSRRSVEIILTYLREKMDPRQVRGYRSGYLPAQRREIEQGLRDGSVRTVVATNALELGIDIGGMEATVLVGYPGSIAATWQQTGRSGRGDKPSLSVFVATAAPLDQYLARNPEYLFERSPEQALINPDNLLILLEHIRCAAFELPFSSGEHFGSVPPERVQEYLEFLYTQGTLHRTGARYFWMADEYPAQRASLRSASANKVILQTQGTGEVRTIGEVDFESACWLVHPGAIYLHEAQTFHVDTLDLAQSIAILNPTSVDYYTEPRSETTVELINQADEQTVSGGLKTNGDIKVTTRVTGFRKIRWYSHETLAAGELTLPPAELVTTGYWVSISNQSIETLQEQGLWNSSPNDYGPGWNNIREAVRSRDGYRCQVCGAPERLRTHDVHHKIPLRSFKPVDGQPAYRFANRMENLTTLCQTCHRQAETAVRIRSGLSGLAYALGNIAPFLLMCDPRDLGVHHDPKSPLSAGQPTVVLYDRIPAGIGFSQRLFELHADLLVRTGRLVSTCECADGCPSCVGPAGENSTGGKAETLAILQIMTAQNP